MDLLNVAKMAGQAFKQISEFSEAEVIEFAQSVGGKNADALITLMQHLQASEPNAKAGRLLETEAVGKLLNTLQQELNNKPDFIYCTCPVCSATFESEIKKG